MKNEIIIVDNKGNEQETGIKYKLNHTRMLLDLLKNITILDSDKILLVEATNETVWKNNIIPYNISVLSPDSSVFMATNPQGKNVVISNVYQFSNEVEKMIVIAREYGTYNYFATQMNQIRIY